MRMVQGPACLARQAELRHVQSRPTRAVHNWLAAAICAIAVGLSGCGNSGSGSGSGAGGAGRRGGAGGPPPVVVATARIGDLPIYLVGLGSVTPFQLVTVQTRVDGQIMSPGFHGRANRPSRRSPGRDRSPTVSGHAHAGTGTDGQGSGRFEKCQPECPARSGSDKDKRNSPATARHRHSDSRPGGRSSQSRSGPESTQRISIGFILTSPPRRPEESACNW
jgi:hypothetical protein